MKKNILLALALISLNSVFAQKLQLTEAATEYKNNLSPGWMMQPDQLQKNKAILTKAKTAIDASYNKQLTTPFTKSKDETKMYYYRGMIYVDYVMMAAMDKEVMASIESIPEDELNNASLGSLKKCLELDTKGEWKNLITRKIGMLRGMMINGGVELFQKEDYANAYEAFKSSVELYDVLSIPDTLGMINAALAAERIKNFDNAYTYYKMCADNNYGEGAEMYQSMIRVLTAKEDSDDEKVISVIEEGKKKFPGDFVLNVEEFNFWYAKGDNTKAQLALQKAIEADPNKPELHFNIGVTFDNMSSTSHENKKHDEAFEFMNKSIEAYKKAIELKPNYTDAYYNLGALYVNQSQEVRSIAGDYEGDKYEKEMNRGKEMMKEAFPYLEKVLEITPDDKSTLSTLKGIYFNLEMMDEYSRIKAKLDSL